MSPIGKKRTEDSPQEDSPFLLRPTVDQYESSSVSPEGQKLEIPHDQSEKREPPHPTESAEKQAKTEKLPEQEPQEQPKQQQEKEHVTPARSTGVAATSGDTQPPKDETTMAIETILADNLADVFVQMTPQQQEQFQKKGEQAAEKIKNLIDTAKATTKKVLKIIRDWLKFIPGVNRFFLEQEAKIKTDRILELVEEKKRDQLHLN